MKNSKVPPYCHVLALVCAAIIVTLALAVPSERSTAAFDNQPRIIEEITLPPLDTDGAEWTNIDHLKTNLNGDSWHTTKVNAGEGLYQVFSRMGLSTNDLNALLVSGDTAKLLTDLHPGQVFKVRMDGAGNLVELVLEINEIKGIRAIRESDGYQVNEYTHTTEKRRNFSSGVIDHSLYQSAQAAGLSDRLIMQLAEIFGWDIDFALDIHPGDSFAVLYEEDYLNGEKIGNGDILAAEFTNDGKSYQALRYVHPDGSHHYYTPEGRSMRQAFLRSPVDFRRISSPFQPNRWHPILGSRRPHRGVDYAATTGTPIKAAGDGKVIFVGRKGGYGNTVILQHGKHYSTLYGHMSKFKKGLHRGSKVAQGDIIGYVGMTGLATGPHLHYEFRVDGVHRDPVTVKLPKALSIEPEYLADFQRKTATLLAEIDLYKRSYLTLNDSL